MHMKKTTLIAMYAESREQLSVVFAHVQSVASLARKNNNHIIYAILGVSDDVDTVEAVLESVPAANRRLLAGASELKHTSDDNATWKQYLDEATLLAFVPDSLDSDTGTWLLPSSGDACLGIVPRGSMSVRDWAAAINSQPREGLGLPATGSDTPFARLGAESGMVATAAMRVSTMQRTIKWVVSDPRDVFCWPHTQAAWSALSISNSVSWAVTSSCAKTIAGLNVPEVKLDKQLTIEELQYDVSLTLASLITQTKMTLPNIRGVIGPLVIAGRGDEEPMRAIEWTDNVAANERVLMLLPESYVQLAFPDYDGPHFGIAQWVNGFLYLENTNALVLRVEGCQEEAEDVAAQMGTRLWRLPQNTPDHSFALTAMERFKTVTEVMVYHTQYDASKTTNRTGTRVPSSRHSIFYTNTPSSDHLTGLRVRWVFASDRPNMPTLDSDNRDGGEQLEYETVA